jgi:hypothetical protein
MTEFVVVPDNATESIDLDQSGGHESTHQSNDPVTQARMRNMNSDDHQERATQYRSQHINAEQIVRLRNPETL